MKARLRLLIAFAVPLAVACADHASGTGPVEPAIPAGAVPMATIQATVDIAAGTLTLGSLPVSPASRRSPSDISAAIYGNQGVTVRLYNSPVVTGPPLAGKKTLSANVGIQNLLPHAIGDEQLGVPEDTIGIYAFINSGPTVVATSSPCSPACTVTAQNHHGTRAFNAPGQQFWHWPERLGPAGSATDTTRLRKAWVFQADTQVTVFTFDILISATWPPANESRWKVEFTGDSAPHIGAEPRWRPNAGVTGTQTLDSPSAGVITLTTPAAGAQYYMRRDSIGPTTNAYMEARFQTNSTTTAPEISFAIDDDTRFIGVGISGTRVGFLNGSFGFATPSFATTTTTLRTYQIRKFGVDSAQLWVDGVRLDSRLYGSFPVSFGNAYPFFIFGGTGVGPPPLSSPAGNSSSWDYVIFEKGVTQP